MHTCVYVIIGSHINNIPAAVAKALAPFNDALQVPPYKIRLNASAIQLMAEHYGIKASNHRALAEKIPEWIGGTGGVDQHGLFAAKTDNPSGKWDGYEIGGRWTDLLGGRSRDVASVKSLLRDRRLSSRLPAAIVTPTGEWVEKDRVIVRSFGWFVASTSASDWRIHVRRILSSFPSHLVVCVDVHC